MTGVAAVVQAIVPSRQRQQGRIKVVTILAAVLHKVSSQCCTMPTTAAFPWLIVWAAWQTVARRLGEQGRHAATTCMAAVLDNTAACLQVLQLVITG